MKKANIFVSILTLFVACFGVFVGCGSKGSIEITSESGICSVAPSEILKIKTSLKKVDAKNVSFSIIEGGDQAYITNDGLLTANNDATVGTELKIQAESKKDGVKSNVLVVTITNKLTSAISITSDRNFLTENIKSLQLTAVFDNYVTDRNVIWSVSSDSSFVTVDSNGKVSLVENGGGYPQNNTSFKIKATYVSDPTIFGEIELTYLLPHTSLSAIAVEDVFINAQSDSEKYMTISGYGANDVEYGTIDAEYFTFESSNPSVATVNNQGKIEVHGHGKTEITVTLNDGNSNISRKGNVYVFATPNSISFDALKTGSYVANIANKMSFGKGDALKLYEMLAFSNSEGLAGCTAVKYFVNGVERTYSDGLSFSEEGEVTVKVVADPTIEGVSAEDMPTLTPVEFEFKLDVNNGVNIKTVAQFQAFANQTINTTANILCDIVLTATENFGCETKTKWLGLELRGDRYINGNGYTLNTSNLAPITTSDNSGQSLLYFIQKDGVTTPLTVQIRHFNLIGQITVDGKWSKDNTTMAINVKENNKFNFLGTYKRGIEVNDEKFKSSTQKNGVYVQNFVLDDVSIKNFSVGMRIAHVVDGLLDDVTIDNCFSNGIESVQNVITINNITLGKMGAFGIEMCPEDVVMENGKPQGTSGANFNQPQSLNLTGTVYSGNYQVDSGTPYMKDLESSDLGGQKISQILNALVQGMISYATSSLSGQELAAAQAKLVSVMNSIMRQNASSTGAINYYMLVFINQTKFDGYSKGNSENSFAVYPNKSNMISMTEILTNLATNADYEGYKNYQYVVMDLDLTSMNMGNLGQVILINEAYEAPKA